MKLVDRIASVLSPKRFNELVSEAVKRELDKAPRWLLDTADAERYGLPDPFVYMTQADMYRLSPILGTALDVLGNDIGLSKPNVKRRVGEEVRDVPNHEFETRVYGSLKYPNPLESGMEFLKATAIGRVLNGNHVWWLNRTSWYEKPAEIWQWPFERVRPVPDGRQYIKHYEYYPNGAKEPVIIPTYQIVHFKTYNPHSPFVGLSPLESLAETIVGDLGMRKTSAQAYTERGGSPPDILAFSEWIENEAWNEMKREIEKSSKENKTLRLRGTKGDVKWMTRSVSNKESDFVQMLSSNMEDVFNRVAPGLLAMLGKDANRSTADAARATYEEKTHWTMLEEISAKVTSEILPAYGRNLFLEFDDPRVVDRALKLQEQEAYERSHTYNETRMEHYGDEPLEGEIGEMLVGQTKAPDAPQPTQRQDNMRPNTETQPVDDQMENISDDTTTVKSQAIKALYGWRRQVKDGRWEKARKFSNPAISLDMERAIKAELKNITDPQQGVVVVERYIDSLKPKPHVEPLVLLRGLEAGVKALQIAKRK